MTAADLEELDGLLGLAASVVALRDVSLWHGIPEGESGWGAAIALRHDVDDNPGALDAAVRLAAWEHARGYRSTYFILHTARYWDAIETPAKLEQIACLGHEIALHANAIPAALATGQTPERVLLDAIAQLRVWGHDVVGVAPHGDGTCRRADGSLRFVNDEVFSEGARPELGAPDRALGGPEDVPLFLDPKPLAYYGLEYDAYRIPRGYYLSDSGDCWAPSIAQARFHFEAGLDAPLQILQHPDWWVNAL